MKLGVHDETHSEVGLFGMRGFVVFVFSSQPYFVLTNLHIGFECQEPRQMNTDKLICQSEHECISFR